MKSVFERRFAPVRQVLTKGSEKRFRAVWDFHKGTYLSRDQFDQIDMYNQTKYRHRANIRVIDLSVWTGLEWAHFTTLDTPELRHAVEGCRVLHESSFETDAFGFKKTDFPIKLGEPTVLFLGDSYTEGLHVPSSQTFVNLFGYLMEKDGLRGTPVNAGVNGYGALEEAWTAEAFASRLNARVVIESLFLNDAGDVKLVLENSAPPRAYQEMFDDLDRLRRSCEEGNRDLVVAAIPFASQVAHPTFQNLAFQRKVQRWCHQHDVLFLDPLPYLAEHGGTENFFSWDPHLSPEGHRNYADFLFETTRDLLRGRFSRLATH